MSRGVLTQGKGNSCMTEPDEANWDTEQVKGLLITREHARADAWMRKDRRAREALLGTGYVEVNSVGRFTRAELFGMLFPFITLHNFVMGEPQIRMYADKTAVLIYRCRERLTIGTEKKDGTFEVTATYTRNGKQFRLARWESRQVSEKSRAD